MRAAVAIALWLGLLFPAVAGIVAALIAALLGQWDYAKDCARNMDRLGAAFFGWGGDYTISAECGSRRKGCRFCKLVCMVIGWVQPGHCEGAAAREKLN